ncbi:MAG: AAA family ATPase, partial [Bacteroidota bacterium]
MAIKMVDRIHLFGDIVPNNIPRLIFIHAPSGSGKTVLAKQFIEAMQTPIVWHTVDFWQQDIVELHKASRQCWQETYSSFNTPEKPTSPRQSAKWLAQAIGKSTTKQIIYVIDDVHHLANNLDTEVWLQTLLESSPSQVRFVFIGQAVPTIDWITQIGRGEVFSLNANDLRLSVEDVCQMSNLSVVEAEEIIEKHNGWMTAIRLEIDPQVQKSMDDLVRKDLIRESAFDNVLMSLFLNLTIDQQKALLLASCSEITQPAIYENLFSLSELQALLESLYMNHFLVAKTKTGYRIHELFRKLLQTHFKELDEGEYQRAHLVLAQWYEEQDEFVDAVTHYLKGDYVEKVIGLTDSIVNELLVRGMRKTLMLLNERLSHLPIPRLHLMLSVQLADYNQSQKAEFYLIEAEKDFRKQNDLVRLACVDLHRAFLEQRQGKYSEALLR